jgi:rhodanese-related sulfurtransferase
MKSVSRDMAGIILKAAVVGLCFNAFAPKGLPLIRVAPVKVAASDSALFSMTPPPLAPLHERAMKNPDSVKAQVFTIISLDQFKKLIARGQGMILDARNKEDYVKAHVPHARNVPAIDVDQYFEQLAPIPRDTLIIIYCNNPDCHLGRQLAEFMAVMEFKKMVLYDDGWDGWTKAGMPVDSTMEKF